MDRAQMFEFSRSIILHRNTMFRDELGLRMSGLLVQMGRTRVAENKRKNASYKGDDKKPKATPTSLTSIAAVAEVVVIPPPALEGRSHIEEAPSSQDASSCPDEFPPAAKMPPSAPEENVPVAPRKKRAKQKVDIGIHRAVGGHKVVTAKMPKGPYANTCGYKGRALAI